jgi:two-component system, NarL family, response regulator
VLEPRQHIIRAVVARPVAKKAPAIHVLIVDDHRVVRDGLALIIQREPDLAVAGTASTGEEAVALYERERPDVVLMDLQLSRMTGVEAILAIRKHDPTARVVVLTMYGGDEDIHRALQAGATTYVLKGSPSEDLIQVLRNVHAGGRPLSEDVKARLEDRAARPTLTGREVRVLQLVLEGLRNKEIAATLSIAEETVEVHLRNIFAKLGVHDRTAAIYVALRRGIVHIG